MPTIPASRAYSSSRVANETASPPSSPHPKFTGTMAVQKSSMSLVGPSDGGINGESALTSAPTGHVSNEQPPQSNSESNLKNAIERKSAPLSENCERWDAQEGISSSYHTRDNQMQKRLSPGPSAPLSPSSVLITRSSYSPGPNLTSGASAAVPRTRFLPSKSTSQMAAANEARVHSDGHCVFNIPFTSQSDEANPASSSTTSTISVKNACTESATTSFMFKRPPTSPPLSTSSSTSVVAMQPAQSLPSTCSFASTKARPTTDLLTTSIRSALTLSPSFEKMASTNMAHNSPATSTGATNLSPKPMAGKSEKTKSTAVDINMQANLIDRPTTLTAGAANNMPTTKYSPIAVTSPVNIHKAIPTRNNCPIGKTHAVFSGAFNNGAIPTTTESAPTSRTCTPKVNNIILNVAELKPKPTAPPLLDLPPIPASDPIELKARVQAARAYALATHGNDGIGVANGKVRKRGVAIGQGGSSANIGGSVASGSGKGIRAVEVTTVGVGCGAVGRGSGSGRGRGDKKTFIDIATDRGIIGCGKGIIGSGRGHTRGVIGTLTGAGNDALSSISKAGANPLAVARGRPTGGRRRNQGPATKPKQSSHAQGEIRRGRGRPRKSIAWKSVSNKTPSSSIPAAVGKSPSLSCSAASISSTKPTASASDSVTQAPSDITIDVLRNIDAPKGGAAPGDKSAACLSLPVTLRPKHDKYATKEHQNDNIHGEPGDDDDEYARFVRSLMIDNNGNNSVVSLHTLQSTAGGVVSHVDGGSVSGAMEGSIDFPVSDNGKVGPALDDLDDASYHLTSDNEEDDLEEDYDDDNNVEEIHDAAHNYEEGEFHDMEGNAKKNEKDEIAPYGSGAKPGNDSSRTIGNGSSTRGEPLNGRCRNAVTVGSEEAYAKEIQEALPPTPPGGTALISPETTDDDIDPLGVFGEIEGLIEEDLEAAVATLLQSEPPLGSCPGNGEYSTISRQSCNAKAVGNVCRSGKTPVSTLGIAALAGTQQQKAITTPGQSTKRKLSTTTVVTTPSPLQGSSLNGFENVSPSASDSSSARSQRPMAATNGPIITRDQVRRLRAAMARHHQLLLQQATLAVRAAHVQKVQKESSSDVKAAYSKESVQASRIHRLGTQDGSNSSNILPYRPHSGLQAFCPPERRCTYRNDFFSGETADDLAEVLDGAVGMLQDLEQNWKDAIRNSIQLSQAPRNSVDAPIRQAQGGRRKLLPTLGKASQPCSESGFDSVNAERGAVGRPLTRSAFIKTLREREVEMTSGCLSLQRQSLTHPRSHRVRRRISIFEVRGLARLGETFSAIDNSVNDIHIGREPSKGTNSEVNILRPVNHGEACEILLRHAGAEIDLKHIPGHIDLGQHLTYAPEAFTSPNIVFTPLTEDQKTELRKNRSQFTAGEDNLILRGVNLYGEKEWVLISDRFLPDRIVTSISQRYNRLCFLIYKANGIFIDEKGKLAPIPVHPEGASNFDLKAISMIKPATPPTTMNVHRWSLEEDITLLKAVPLMGNMWAEICNRLMTHRDRGHIRKRYQVLERRIPKGVTKMYLKRQLGNPSLTSRATKRTRASATSGEGKHAASKKTVVKKSSAAKGTVLVPAPDPAQVIPNNSVRQPSSPVNDEQLIHATEAKHDISGILMLSTESERLGNANRTTSIPPPTNMICQNSPACSIKAAEYHSPPFKKETDETDEHTFDSSIGTRNMAALVEGFSSASHSYFTPREQDFSNAGETTRMGVEKILENGDSWSQASGMQRLIDCGTAESNNAKHSAVSGIGHISNNADGTAPISVFGKPNNLPLLSIEDVEASGLSTMNGFNFKEESRVTSNSERKSILSTIMDKTKENALKRKCSDSAPCTPENVSPNVKYSASPSDENAFCDGFTPSSAMAFSFGFGLSASKSQASVGEEFFRDFISERSRQTVTGPAPPTPSSQLHFFGGLSGPVPGCNSLLMGASDFDAVSALKDLSNSVPPTSSNLVFQPKDLFSQSQMDPGNPGKEPESEKPKTSFLAKVKAKVKEKELKRKRID